MIFVQCWDKTSLHSLGHRGCHCRIASAGEESQPSESDPRPLAAARHHQQSGGAYFCIFVIFVCASYSRYIFFYAYTVTWTWKIWRQRRGCAAYFASHTLTTKIYFFSACDWPRAWNSKSLRLPDKLACLRKRCLACDCCHRDSPLIWTVTLNGISTNLIHCVVSQTYTKKG